MPPLAGVIQSASAPEECHAEPLVFRGPDRSLHPRSRAHSNDEVTAARPPWTCYTLRVKRSLLAVLVVACSGPPQASPPPDTPSAVSAVVAQPPAPGAQQEPQEEPAPEPPPPPRPLVAEGEPLPLLGAGDDFTCLLFPDRVTCFGKVPGSGNATSVTHAVQADLLQVGSRNYCVARRGEREVRCFGQMPFPGGELWNRWEAACRGDADCIEREFEAYTHAGLRLPTRGAVRDLAGLEERFCAVAGEELVCWDLTEEDPARRPAVARIAGAREVEMGSGMTCVLTAAGAVRCREDFGSADTGPFGPIANLPRVERIAVQGNWGCGWTADGEAHCWGVEVPPDGSELEERSAQRVPVLDGVQAASSNWNPRAVSCVLDGSGRTRCWGDDRYGQLGRPPRAGGAVTDPVEPPIEGARAIAVGAAHACAIDAGRVLRCWGRADRGALGARYARRSFGPVRVQGVRADALALYDDRSCARTAAGWVCWGRLPQDRVAEPWIPRAIDMPVVRPR